MAKQMTIVVNGSLSVRYMGDTFSLECTKIDLFLAALCCKILSEINEENVSNYN